MFIYKVNLRKDLYKCYKILNHIMYTQAISDTHTHSYEVISPMSRYSK